MELLTACVRRMDDGRYRVDLPVSNVPINLDTSFEFERDESPDGTMLYVYFRAEQSGQIEMELEVGGYSVERDFEGSYESAPGTAGPSATARPRAPEAPVNPYERASLLAELGVSMMINGEGGSGKSYTSWEIAANLMLKHGKSCGIMAMTGLAADELQRGLPEHVAQRFADLGRDPPQVQTFHSFFGCPKAVSQGLGFEPIERLVATWHKMLTPRSTGGEAAVSTLIKNWGVDVILIDEVSMLECELLDVWGGVLLKLEHHPQIILVGDFAQLPPVSAGGLRGDAPAAGGPDTQSRRKARYAFESGRWPDIVDTRVIRLDHNHRVDDPPWQELLSRLRRGTPSREDLAKLEAMSSSQPGKEVTDAHLCLVPTNAMAQEENGRRCAKLRRAGAPGQRFPPKVTRVTKISGGERETITATYADHECARRMVCAAIRDHGGELGREILVGAFVMLTINLSVKDRLVNGARGVVTEVAPDGVTVRFEHAGRHKIAWKTLELADRVSLRQRVAGIAYTASVRVLPLELAFAITIHKCQGATLNKVYVKLSRQVGGMCDKVVCAVFQPGQIYVALSRARRAADVVVDGIELCEEHLTLDPEVKKFCDRTYVARVADEGPTIGLPSVHVDIYSQPTPLSRTPLTVLALRATMLSKLIHQRDQQILDRKLVEQERTNRRNLLRQRSGGSASSETSQPSIPF